MNAQKLDEIIENTTTVYRKGDIVELKELENVKVTEVSLYRHTDYAPSGNNYDKVDMVFVDVVVDRAGAEKYKSDFIGILKDYPEPERLADGPSYMELAPTLEIEQEDALRLMALGKTLGLWKIISGKAFGMDDAKTEEYAGNGFLMISGYRPKPEK